MVLDSNSYDIFPTNLVLSAGSAALAFISNIDPAISVVLPIAFFIFGKLIDVGVKVYLEKRNK